MVEQILFINSDFFCLLFGKEFWCDYLCQGIVVWHHLGFYFLKFFHNSSFSFFFSVSGADGASANGNLFLITSIFSYLVG
jgi:hypothetical protein